MNKWAEYFLVMAKHASTLSKDPSTKVGAVAVGDKNQILSTGFNGFSRGIKDTNERLNNRELKYPLIIHAEMNVIYNACLNGTSLNGATLYVYGLPVCQECARGIDQVGIKKVIMQFPKDITDKWKESFEKTKQYFREAEITYIVHEDD